MLEATAIRIVSANASFSCSIRRHSIGLTRHCKLSSPHQNTNRHFKSSMTSHPSHRQQSTAFTHDNATASAHHVPRKLLLTQPRESLQSFLLKPRTVPVPRWVSPHHYTTTLSEVLGHSSFILVAASYAMDDFLQLRIVAVAGSSAMLFFTYFHPYGRVLWLPFKWNVCFILINSYRIGKVYIGRFYAANLAEEFKTIRQNHFYVLDPVDFYKLVKLGRTETFKKGDLLVAQVCCYRNGARVDHVDPLKRDLTIILRITS